MAFDPYAPYGPVVESTVRVVTWNVWGRYGTEWEARHRGIASELADAAPDIVCLVESWRSGESSQPQLIAEQLGLAHHTCVGDWQQEDWISGTGLVSRWPFGAVTSHPLHGEDGAGVGAVVHVVVDGDRGSIDLFVAMLDYPLGASVVRQSQVSQLASFIADRADPRHLTVLCGDFNAGPDADEIRMLTGRAAAPRPGVVFYDAWEIAGDGTPGITWSNHNPLAAVGLYPDRRFDYIFSAWPRRGGVGHPTHCSLLGVRSADEQQLSDHYGVLADLRY